MINNPFITKHYPGLVSWLNYAQTYQAHPDDYAITRPTSSFRVTVSDTNKGARGIIAYPETRKLVGYLDPNDTIYLDYIDLQNNVALETQVFRNTSVQLEAKDIERFESTGSESGMLYLNKETPWGVEPVQLNVVVYGKPLYTTELTFRTTEAIVIPPTATADSINLDGVEWQTGSEINRTVEPGIHALRSLSKLAELVPFFQALGKPDIVELTALRGMQHNQYYNKMSELTTKIESVGANCIFINDPTGTPVFFYFDVPVGEFKGPVFAPGTKLGAIGPVFQKGTYGTLPSDILKNVVFGNDIKGVNLNYMFKGATIDTVPSDIFVTLEGIGTTTAKVTCRQMFAETTVSVFPDDILEGLPVTTLAAFFEGASLPSFPRIIPKSHRLVSLIGEYTRVYAQERWVTKDLFKWLEYGMAGRSYSLIGTFEGSNIQGFDPELKFDFTSIRTMTRTFSNSELEVIPVRMFDTTVNMTDAEYIFDGTPITDVPDRLFYNCPALVSVTGFCSICKNLTNIGSELFHPNITVTIYDAFSSRSTYYNVYNLSRTAFSGVTIKNARNAFRFAKLRNVYIDAPIIDLNGMFSDATIDVIETGALRGDFTDIGSALTRANITVLGDRAIQCIGTGGPVAASELLGGTKPILKGGRLFEPLTVDQQWSLGVSSTWVQSLLGSPVSFSWGFNTVSDILHYLALPYTPDTITLVKDPNHTYLAGSPQDVIEANVGITNLTAAETFIGNSTRFGVKSETGRKIGYLKDNRSFLGYFNNGKIKVRPLWVSYYNREFVLDGVDRRTNPGVWFAKWIAMTEYPTFERMWHGVVGDYLVFSPVGPVSEQNLVAEYNYVFSQGPELPELTFTDFGHEDWFMRFIDKDCQYDFPESHGSLVPADRVGRVKYTINPEFQSMYNGFKGGTTIISGFYGSLQRLIHYSVYSAPTGVDYSGYTVPQIIALLKEYTGYEFLPSMFTGVVSQSEDRLVIGTTSEFLGTDFSLRLR